MNKTMKQLLVFFSILLFWNSQAQHLGIKVQESKVFKQATARVQNDYILPVGDGSFITIATKRTGFLANPLVFESYATLYNNQLEQIQTKSFRLNKGVVKGAIKGAFIKNGSLYMIKMDVNNRKRYISFKRISARISDKTIDEKEFYKINHVYSKNDVNLYVDLGSLFYQKLKYYSDVNFYNPKIFVKFSENKHFFTIIYRDFTEMPTRYITTTFNDKFEKVFSKTIIENRNAKTFYIDDVVVDDVTGKTLVIAKTYKGDPHIRINAASVSKIDHYNLYKIDGSGIKKITIDPKAVVDEFSLLLDKNQLSVIGFYRNTFVALNDIDGIARINLDANSLSIATNSYQNFKKKLVTVKFKSKHKRSKNHKMIIRKIFHQENGDIVISAEDYFIPDVLKKHNRELTLSEYTGDVFSIRVSQSGAIIWAKSAYKLQKVKPRLAMHSFFPTIVNGNYYLFFTDSKTKKQPKDVAFYLRDKDLQNLNGVKISLGGAMQSGIVKEHTRTKFRMMPIEGVMITKNEAIIPAKDHHLIRFYKLTF